MTHYLLIIIAWCTLNELLPANPSLTTNVSRIDGLPARILKGSGIDRDLLSDAKSIDLAPALKAMGCRIEDGETIFYHAPSGTLLRNLSEEHHRIVNEIIDNLYRTDNLLTTYRVYIDLLEPLSGDERLKLVKRVGFLPDPLVSSMVSETKSAEGGEGALEQNRKTLALLNIALDRMKRQIAVMENSETERTAATGGGNSKK